MSPYVTFQTLLKYTQKCNIGSVPPKSTTKLLRCLNHWGWGGNSYLRVEATCMQDPLQKPPTYKISWPKTRPYIQTIDYLRSSYTFIYMNFELLKYIVSLRYTRFERLERSISPFYICSLIILLLLLLIKSLKYKYCFMDDGTCEL